MPYAEDHAGIYRVVDTSTGACYVGQSRRLKKRIAEHFRLLGHGTHPNPHLQNAYNLAGRDAFSAEMEVLCDDPKELDVIEEAFLQGDAKFDESPRLFNISSTARKPMDGRKHTDATKARISAAKAGQTEHVTTEYKAKLSKSQRARALRDPEYRAKVIFIVSNPDLSYAERGRRVGIDTSTARKIALKYKNERDLTNG